MNLSTFRSAPMGRMASTASTAAGRLLLGHGSQTVEDRNYRNLMLSGLWFGPVDGGIFNFLPVFLARLGASASLISLLTSAPSFLGILTYLPGGAYVERQRDLAARRAELAAEPERLAAVDGRPADLDTNPSPHLVPWVSESWGRLFGWRGRGALPEPEAIRLRDFVQRAHAQGRRVRFWAAPDTEESWRVQLTAPGGPL